ncbi:hypothetical protein [Methylocystis sp.]|uniref:hypothetical protein n=1 Tax=Methylocystis sp. TaxID=1911079 RepID=UPI0027335696|nr:hypothetical protein [Methylocystis sp.]
MKTFFDRFKRLWGVRHVRAVYLAWKFEKWWDECGRYLGAVPNPSDAEYIGKVWRGEL